MKHHKKFIQAPNKHRKKMNFGNYEESNYL